VLFELNAAQILLTDFRHAKSRRDTSPVSPPVAASPELIAIDLTVSSGIAARRRNMYGAPRFIFASADAAAPLKSCAGQAKQAGGMALPRAVYEQGR
jgi:hypothetical protein